ncbi:MAG: hypothetical protein ACYC4L_06285 [Chloroflexota bacterium]
MLDDRQSRYLLAQMILAASLLTWPLVGYLAYRWKAHLPARAALLAALIAGIGLAILSVVAIFWVSAAVSTISSGGYWAFVCLRDNCLHWVLGGIHLVVVGAVALWLRARGLGIGSVGFFVVSLPIVEGSAFVQVVALWAFSEFRYLGP